MTTNNRFFQLVTITLTLSVSATVTTPSFASEVNTQTTIAVTSSNNYLEMGKQYFAQKDYEKALVSLDKAVKSENAAAFYWRGQTLAALGESELAIADFKLAVCGAAKEGNLVIYNQAMTAYNNLVK